MKRFILLGFLTFALLLFTVKAEDLHISTEPSEVWIGDTITIKCWYTDVGTTPDTPYAYIEHINQNTLWTKNDFSQESVEFSFYWFFRNWIYAIPSLAILASIGVISFKKRLHRMKLFKLNNRKIRRILRLSLTFFLITLFSSNFIIGGLHWGNKERQIKDSEVEFFSWMHEKFPKGSTLLTEV